MNRIALIAVLVLLGCNSNPYSGVSGKLSPDPVQAKPGDQTLAIHAPTLVDMTENTPGTFTVTGHVGAAGKPIIDIQNLPPGAKFDPVRGTVTWTPPLGAGIDSSNPSSGEKAYLVDVNLKSSSQPNAHAEQTVAILVHHPVQNLIVTGLYFPSYVQEGTTYTANIRITGGDVPQGPFTVSAVSLPAGMSISPTDDPAIYTITYTPAYNVVTESNYTGMCSGHRCSSFSLNLRISDPRGGLGTPSTSWQVIDVRVNPIVAIPQTVAAEGTTADFYVHVEDPNGDSSPRVNVTPPATGTVAVTTVSSSMGTSLSNPYGMFHIVWSGNPDTVKGTKVNLVVNSCVDGFDSGIDLCVPSNVSVQF